MQQLGQAPRQSIERDKQDEHRQLELVPLLICLLWLSWLVITTDSPEIRATGAETLHPRSLTEVLSELHNLTTTDGLATVGQHLGTKLAVSASYHGEESK